MVSSLMFTSLDTVEFPLVRSSSLPYRTVAVQLTQQSKGLKQISERKQVQTSDSTGQIDTVPGAMLKPHCIHGNR